MSLTLTSIEIEAVSLSQLHAQDALHHRAVLNELIDMAKDMARLVLEQTKVQAVAPPSAAAETRAAVAEMATAFAGLGRCMRRGVLLVAKLAEPVAVAAPARPRVAARQRIIRGVEDAIQREADGLEAASLHAEMLDRLDSPELEDEIGTRPVGEIIAEISRDLGLGAMPGSHPWARRTPADLAVLCARAEATPRSRRQAEGAGAPVAEGAPGQSGAALAPRVPRCRDP